MRKVTVARYMTRGAQTIGHREPLATAHRMMNELGVRHLPVLESGQLVGVVSQRDLHFIETLPGVDRHHVAVEEAMTADVLTISGRTSLRRVARDMAERKAGSAVVVDAQGRVEGIFTTTDVLKALVDLLAPDRRTA